MNDRQILLNMIQTPDGTILTSRSRHDYQTYTDANGEVYMVDGGNEYLRRNKNNISANELTIYVDDDIELIREHMEWGTYGKDGDQPLTWVLLKDMSVDHIKACIKMKEDHGILDYIYDIFNRELGYREDKLNEKI